VNRIEELEKEGRLLPIVEEFYSIQGEGAHTGKAAYFLRIGGCDVCCNWCDVKESWNAKQHPLLDVDDIILRIFANPSKSVIITGGEPLKYNLDYLCGKLKDNDIQTYLETSGSAKLSGVWDWICLSPKKELPPLKSIYSRADELKVVIENIEDIKWAEYNAQFVNKECLLYLQPEWLVRDAINEELINFVLENPKWMISVQTHKYLKIP